MNTTLRPADLDDADQSIENLRELCSHLRIPPLSVEAQSHLSLRFTGEIQHDYLGASESAGFTELIHRVIDSAPHRKLFARVLSNATPLLTAPLYVGVAKCLHDRIAKHKQMIDDISRFQPSDDLAYSFALEVNRRRIPVRRLMVQVLPLEGLDIDLERETAEAAESALNRIFFPILGRR